MSCERCNQGRTDHPTLARCMRAIVDRMRTLSYGKVLPYGGRTASSSDLSPTGNLPSGSITPTRRIIGGNLGELDVMIDQAAYWSERFNAAYKPEDQLRVVERARDALERILHSQAVDVPEETLDELYERLVEGENEPGAFKPEGWPAKDVAIHFQTSVKLVYAARLKHDRDPETGKPNTQAKVNVAEMKRNGLTLRQITTLTGISKSEVHRQLKRAA